MTMCSRRFSTPQPGHSARVRVQGFDFDSGLRRVSICPDDSLTSWIDCRRTLSWINRALRWRRGINRNGYVHLNSRGRVMCIRTNRDVGLSGLTSSGKREYVTTRIWWIYSLGLYRKRNVRIRSERSFSISYYTKEWASAGETEVLCRASRPATSKIVESSNLTLGLGVGYY